MLEATKFIQWTDVEFGLGNVDADGCNSNGPTLLMSIWIDVDAPRVAMEERIIPLDHRVNLHTRSNWEKTLLVSALNDGYRLYELLETIQLPRSSHQYQREALRRPDKYAEARQAITTIFESNCCCYGYRRIGECLRCDGAALSGKVVRRLMSEENLMVGSMQRWRFSSYRGELSPAPENIIARDF